MSKIIESPDFSDWPPADVHKGRSLHIMIKIYLRAKIDAEWRAECLGDATYLDWFIPEYNMDRSIDYLILTNKVEESRLNKWEQCIRDRYDWTVQNH